MSENKFEVDMKMKKKKNPIVYVILGILLVGAFTYTGVSIYNQNKSKPKEPVKEEKNKDMSAYLSTDTKLDSKTPKEVEEFVDLNKDKKGAYLLQTEEYSYVLVTAGKIVDKKAFNISIDSPVFNKDKTAATITYQLVPFEASDDQKNNEPDFTLLKLNKVDSVTTMETNGNVVVKSEK